MVQLQADALGAHRSTAEIGERRVRPKGHEESGFEMEPDVLTSPEVFRLAKALEVVKGRSRAGARHLMSHDSVLEVANDPRLLGIAHRWLGPSASPYHATLFDKSPGSNWLVVWHQDTALPLRFRRDVSGWGPWSVKAGVLYAHAPAGALEGVVALRVHLDDSTPENGPLRVLPGTHRGGVLADGAIQELVRLSRTHQCVVGRGGIIAMRPLLVHASSKSASSAPRRVLHIEYAASFQVGSDLELDVA
jgi:Phytanoyl-CoA dioxygenase (PhyH)